ncbi:MAG: zf-HC2 domain-containing protein [Deltaproteobacteria bacterium]|jgi:anti-sigma factor RsiW|nr:zf-HC2 domain-containing protein [Deltaproteobacteria bacterium]
MQEHLSCLSCKRRLSAYIDGELAPALMTAVKAHLASCPACRLEYDALRAVMEVLYAQEAPEPRRGLDATVMDKITREERGYRLPQFIPVPVYAAAFGLFVGVFLANGALPQRADNPMIAADDGIMQAMDVFSPSPQGSFSNAYFTMLHNPGR